jgi:hypothetical protein
MGKKEKMEFALAEDVNTITAVVPKLEAVLKAYKEIATGYQKYRKNGGEAISGIEKHLGIKEQKSIPPAKKEKVAQAPATKATEEVVEVKKDKKKSKK